MRAPAPTSLRLSVEEREAVQKAAGEAGMTASAWLRAVIVAALGSRLSGDFRRARSASVKLEGSGKDGSQ